MKKGLEDKVDKVSLSSRVQSFEEVNRELTKVNDTLNALLEKTTQTSEVDTTEGTEGNPGDIKTILNSDKTYSFSIRTEDGWKTPFLESREIIFKSKNPNAGEIKKSIDEIESKSIDEAKKTIFDEKADKFVLPRPDYDSGWVTWDWSQYKVHDGPERLELNHNLGVFPSLYRVYFAPGQAANSVTWFTTTDEEFGASYDWGIATKITTTYIYLEGGEAGSLVSSNWNTPGGSVDRRATYQDGSVKILMWK